MALLPLFLSQEHMAGKINRFKSLLISGLLLFVGVNALANDYLEIEAKRGDGISVILNRYELAAYQCNVDSFLSLNKLESSSFLLLGKKYRLPVYVFEYNGSSIRGSLGIADYQKALRIQKYNERMLEIGLRLKDFREDKVLWVPIHEYYCPENEVTLIVSEEPAPVEAVDDHNDNKAVLRYEKFPIFGSSYEKTPIYTDNLKGQIYYLISGHGGPDPGAIGEKEGHQLCEDEYAYDVTLRLARNLLQHGATVYMITRDTDGIRDEEYLESDKDETVWFNQKIPYNHVKRLRQRTAKINELYEKHKSEGAKIQRVIEIHIDSRYVEQKVDIFFYYYPGSTAGQTLANQMYSTIKAEYEEHQKNRGYSGVVKGRDLHTLREAKPSSVYIELGNITNEFDQKRLLIVNNRQAIANWLAQGVITYKD